MEIAAQIHCLFIEPKEMTMIRFILKNCWNRRGRYVWLLIELTVVAILCWRLADPIICTAYNRSLPAGYNPDGMFRLPLACYPEKSVHFQAEENTPEAVANHVRRLLDKLRNYPDVSSATLLFQNIGPLGKYTWTSGINVDSTQLAFMMCFFEPRSDFFQTFQFDEVDGQTNEALDQLMFSDKEYVISTGAFPKQPSLGFQHKDTQADTLRWTAKATTGRVKMMNCIQPVLTMFVPTRIEKETASLSDISLNFRIRSGISEQAFLEKFQPWAEKELRSGNIFIRNIASYKQLAHQDDVFHNVTYTKKVNLVIGAFFLVCLILGTSGTFWMQTQSRREEIGILKSFGGTSAFITRTLLGEGFLLTSAATFIGCLVYLQYALKEGLYADSLYVASYGELSIYWVNVFWKHFVGVSVVVWLTLLTAVSIGIFIPARSISRITAADALHDE